MKITKEVYLSYYKTYPYDKFIQLVNKDCLNDKDYIFTDYSQIYNIEDNDIQNKFDSAFAKIEYPYKHSKTSNCIKRRFFSNTYNDNNDYFFDTFDKKVDKSKFNIFKRNIGLIKQLQNNICIIKNKFIDFNESENLFEKTTQVFSVEDFFSIADNFFNDISDNHNKEENQINKVESTIDEKEVNIEHICDVNKYLKIDINKPLWYIFHQSAKSSFGPISSEQIAELYTKNVIDGSTLVRLIDIFSYNDLAPFEYFKLKEIDNTSFINHISISNIVKDAVKNKIGKK